MFNKQQNETKENLQVKFHQYLNSYNEDFTVPEQKFLKDICLGMLKSNSCIIHRIAQNLLEKITVKKTSERFNTHLDKEDLGTKLQTKTIKLQCEGFDYNTAIIVDESDIIKKRAKKMEGLKKVRDGDTGRIDQLGYDLLNIIAHNDSETGYQIKPISSDLISDKLEIDTISQKVHDRLIDIIIASKRKGTYIFDRGFDDRKLFYFLKSQEVDFIVRSTGKRNLIDNDGEEKFLDVAKKVKLQHRYKMKDNNQLLRCGIKKVKVRLDPHPKKNPEVTELWLVVSQYITEDNKKGGYFYLLCNFPCQPNLTEIDIMEKAIHMYGIRWKIEETHKLIKQEYGWEKMQLQSYLRLTNLNQVLLIAVCFMYSLKAYVKLFLEAFPSIMKYSNSRWKKIYDFVYYRISKLISLCFATVTRYKIMIYSGKWRNSQQLYIDWGKNGGM